MVKITKRIEHQGDIECLKKKSKKLQKSLIN